MNWDAIGAIGELLGAAAVLVTLVYLSIQIRQNSKMMKANSKQSISEATQQVMFKMLDEADIMHKVLNGGEFDGTDQTKAWLIVRAMFRGYEAQIYQYEVGLLEEAEWAALKRVILETTCYPGVIKMWPTLSESVSPALRKIVDEGMHDDI